MKKTVIRAYVNSLKFAHSKYTEILSTDRLIKRSGESGICYGGISNKLACITITRGTLNQRGDHSVCSSGNASCISGCYEQG